MPTVKANGIEIAYEDFGDPADEALILVCGMGGNLASWDQPMIDMLVSNRLRVVTFDNRDVGLSSKLEGATFNLGKILRRRRLRSVPYTLHDMADDIAGLMDVVGIERAHLAGASLGGHLVQTFALDHPDRIASLCSIMASTNDGDISGTAPEALALFSLPPVTERDQVIERTVAAMKVCGSKGLPIDWDQVRAKAAAQYDRYFYPAGSGRQLLALSVSGDRTALLKSVAVPTVVIHGSDDRLVHPELGARTAAAIPGAELVIIQGMGHDFPAAAWTELVAAIVANINRARQAG